MGATMTTAEQIYEHAKALPESAAREVLDFVEFIAQKARLAEKSQTPDIAARLEKMRTARGLWAKRDDLPDIRQLRSEWDRGFGQGEA